MPGWGMAAQGPHGRVMSRLLWTLGVLFLGIESRAVCFVHGPSRASHPHRHKGSFPSLRWREARTAWAGQGGALLCSNSEVEFGILAGAEEALGLARGGGQALGRGVTEGTGCEDGGSNLVPELVKKLRQAKSMGTRESQIRLLTEAAPRGDESAISAVCEVLDDFRSHSVTVREAAIESLSQLLSGKGERGDAEAFQCLLASVKRDSAHTVRRAAFELIPAVAVRPRDRSALLDLAMPFLTREDLRGQPLFKPNGDPMSLCTEAITAVGQCAKRGDVGVWTLLERRVIDDATASARVAAVEALAHIADGDILSSGGRRSTIHLLAVGAADPNPAMARACRETLGKLITPEGAMKYWG